MLITSTTKPQNVKYCTYKTQPKPSDSIVFGNKTLQKAHSNGNLLLDSLKYAALVGLSGLVLSSCQGQPIKPDVGTVSPSSLPMEEVSKSLIPENSTNERFFVPELHLDKETMDTYRAIAQQKIDILKSEGVDVSKIDENLIKKLFYYDDEGRATHFADRMSRNDFKEGVSLDDIAIMYYNMDKNKDKNIPIEEEERALQSSSKDYIVDMMESLGVNKDSQLKIMNRLRDNSIGLMLSFDGGGFNIGNIPFTTDVNSLKAAKTIDFNLKKLNNAGLSHEDRNAVLKQMFEIAANTDVMPLITKIDHGFWGDNKNNIYIDFSLADAVKTPAILENIPENKLLLEKQAQNPDAIKQYDIYRIRQSFMLKDGILKQNGISTRKTNTIQFVNPDTYNTNLNSDNSDYKTLNPLAEMFKSMTEKLNNDARVQEFMTSFTEEDMVDSKKFETQIKQLNEAVTDLLGTKGETTLRFVNDTNRRVMAYYDKNDDSINVNWNEYKELLNEYKEFYGNQGAMDKLKQDLVKMMFEEHLHYYQREMIRGDKKPDLANSLSMIEDFKLNDALYLDAYNAVLIGGDSFYGKVNSFEALPEVVNREINQPI